MAEPLMGVRKLEASPDLAYEASLLFWRTVTSIFFREVRPRGAFNIPRDGPVIFVGAPHHNQVCSIYVFVRSV